MEHLQIVALWVTFGIIASTCFLVLGLARRDSAKLRELSVEFAKLASANAIKERIEHATGLIEIHGLKIGELQGQLNALEQTTKSHLQRYYKLEREQRKDAESQQLNDALRENLDALNFQEAEPVEGPSHAHALTRQMGW